MKVVFVSLDGMASRLQINDVCSASLWCPGKEPTKLDLASPLPSDGIACFDLAPSADVNAVIEALGSACIGLETEMVEDILLPDRMPEGEQWADGQIRLASTFGVYPTETKNGRGDWSCPLPSPNLVYQPVELLCGSRWLLTCWHYAETYCGWDRAGAPSEPRGRNEIERCVTKRWIKNEYRTAADLGILLMSELALTYAPAHRQLHAALEEWDRNLFQDVDGDLTKLRVDPRMLNLLWQARSRFLEWLMPLNTPGLRHDIDKAWLPATNHEEVNRVDERVDRALAALSRLGESLRASFHTLQLLSAEAHRDRIEQRQRRIELLATLFIIPTLVVGFYGANTWVPGEKEHWGFWVMVAVIIVLTVIGTVALTAIRSRDQIRMPLLRSQHRVGSSSAPSRAAPRRTQN